MYSFQPYCFFGGGLGGFVFAGGGRNSLGVVAIEKWGFTLPSTTVGQLTYIK